MFALRPAKSSAAPSLLGLLLLINLATVGCPSTDGGAETTVGASGEEIKRLLTERRFEEAVPLLEEVLIGDPGNPEFLFLYGTAQLRMGRPSLAIWGFLEARQHPDWQSRALMALIEVGIAANDREQSVNAATQLIEAEPENETARLLRAESYISLRDFEAALEDADWLLERQNDSVAGHTVRLQGLLGLKRVDEIEQDFDRLEELAKNDAFPDAIAARYCAARATFADESGDAELAIERFESCLSDYPASREVMLAAVSFFDQKGEIARATAILTEIVEREPDAFDLREALSNRLRSLGETEQAEELLLAATKAPGATRTRAWAALAYHYFALENFTRSVDAWKTLFEYLATPDEGMLFAYSEALIHAARFDEAEDVARQLPEQMGELVLGLSELEQGHADVALVHFDAGQRLWPNNAVARYFTGLAAERNGDLDRAVTEFRQSIRIRATDTPAALRLARIHDAEGHFEEARTALGHFLKDRPNDIEGKIFSLRIAAEIKGSGVIEPAFGAMRWPVSQIGEVVSSVAEDAREIAGPLIAVRFLDSNRHIDFGRPAHASVLRSYVDLLIETDRAEEAEPIIDAAIATHPELADFHEIRARWLLGTNAAPGDIAIALDRAFALDSASAATFATRAKLALRSGLTEDARTDFERAGQLDPTDTASRLAAARILIEDGALSEARGALDALRADDPTDANAAALLASVIISTKSETALAERLARCALRFRGGASALAILEQAYFDHGEPSGLGAILATAQEAASQVPQNTTAQ